MSMLQKWVAPSFLEDLGHGLAWPNTNMMNWSAYETENDVVIEAALPGIDETDIEVIFEKGVLMIRGEKRDSEEDKKRRWLVRSNRQFIYRIAVPGNVDETAHPRAESKDGIVKVLFQKQKKTEPTRIPVQRSK